MFLSKLKVAGWVTVLSVVLSAGALAQTFPENPGERGGGETPRNPAVGRPADALEVLRLEIEALRLDLESDANASSG